MGLSLDIAAPNAAPPTARVTRSGLPNMANISRVKNRSERIESIQRAGNFLKRNAAAGKEASANLFSVMLSSGSAFGVGFLVGRRHRDIAADPTLTTPEEQDTAMKVGGIAPPDALAAGALALLAITGVGGKKVTEPALVMAKGVGGYALGSYLADMFYERAKAAA